MVFGCLLLSQRFKNGALLGLLGVVGGALGTAGLAFGFGCGQLVGMGSALGFTCGRASGLAFGALGGGFGI